MVDSPGVPAGESPLLQTKLFVPRRRPPLVQRPRLLEQLDRSSEGKLTLLSAPAGYGKTTLLAAWLADAEAGQRPAAWLSLDRNDNNPGLFWSYVITALSGVWPGIGTGTLASLRAPQPPPAAALLTGLLNEISTMETPCTFILDDYHLIEAEPIHTGIAFLLDHLPPALHLVLATRADPPLPLARLRAQGQLTELRAADLRFTAEEAAAYLNPAMGLDLGAAEVAALEERTEGWIAGLQLAALSLQGRADAPEFIRSFAGDDRYIVDYLVEEVLQRQPEPLRSFLLETSLLDWLSGPLCDAVTGRSDGRAMLEELERGNVFLVPLDDRRRWFRYHHLFAEVLRVHLKAAQPDRVHALHRRASRWHDRHGLVSEAVRHALAGEDFAAAATRMEQAGRDLLTRRQDETLLGWLQALPEEVVRARPVLGVYYALALLSVDLEAAEARLRDAEQLLQAAEPNGGPAGDSDVELVVANPAAFRSLPGTAAIVRAYLAGAAGDVPGIVHEARRALELLPESDHLWRGAAASLLGLAEWSRGELDAAYQAFTEGWASLSRTGELTQELSHASLLAEIRLAQGRLGAAARHYEQAVQRVEGQGDAVPAQAADLYVGLAELHVERDELAAAERYLDKSKVLSGESGMAERRHRWYVVSARLAAARGQVAKAHQLLDEAERQYVPSPAPDPRPAAAWQARLWLRQDRLDAARAWARLRDLAADDDLSYLREFEHITLARLLLAEHRRDGTAGSLAEALGLLDRLLQAAQAGGRQGSLIELWVLQALAHQTRGQLPAALAPLERALTLAAGEGFRRVFSDEGEAMQTLLRHAAAQGLGGAFTRQLLSAWDDPEPRSTAADGAAGLAEPLTPREREILRLVAAGLKNQEIADHLFISLATVKRHLANAYGKLGVGHRTAAVARAHELDLL